MVLLNVRGSTNGQQIPPARSFPESTHCKGATVIPLRDLTGDERKGGIQLAVFERKIDVKGFKTQLDKTKGRQRGVSRRK